MKFLWAVHGDRIRDESATRAYLRRIHNNTCIDWTRRWRPWPSEVDQQEPQNPNYTDALEYRHGYGLGRELALRMVDRWDEDEPPRWDEEELRLFVLAVIMRLPWREIAEMPGSRVHSEILLTRRINRLKTRLHRATRKLVDELALSRGELTQSKQRGVAAGLFEGLLERYEELLDQGDDAGGTGGDQDPGDDGGNNHVR